MSGFGHRGTGHKDDRDGQKWGSIFSETKDRADGAKSPYILRISHAFCFYRSDSFEDRGEPFIKKKPTEYQWVILLKLVAGTGFEPMTFRL